jgi:hypothetical protein
MLCGACVLSRTLLQGCAMFVEACLLKPSCRLCSARHWLMRLVRTPDTPLQAPQAVLKHPLTHKCHSSSRPERLTRNRALVAFLYMRVLQSLSSSRSSRNPAGSAVPVLP